MAQETDHEQVPSLQEQAQRRQADEHSGDRGEDDREHQREQEGSGGRVR